jgi:prepilin-type N-terminal cleavage/methylation domain-containing protein
MQGINFRAFTLVELVVVIAILWILSTIWFVSYSGYLAGARDSNRMSQMVKLSDSLQVYSSSKILPLPDNYIEITASWASNLIAYQGELWRSVLEAIDYKNGGTDPKDGNYHTYYLKKDRRSMQLMTMMEEQSSVSLNMINQSYAINYEERFPKTYGKKLWILTYSDPLNSDLFNTSANLISENITAWFLDVFNLTEEYTAHFWEIATISWVGNKIGMATLWESRLVWAWDFESLLLWNAIDISWKWNNGALSGALIPTTTLWISWNGLDFVSADGISWWFVEIPASTDIDTGTFTVSLWVQADDILDWWHGSQLLKNYAINNVDNGEILTIQWDAIDIVNRQRCRIEWMNWWQYDAQIKSIIDISIWNHIACIFDGERLSVYLNGVLEDSIYVDEPINRWKASMKIWAWWSSATSTNNYFDGKIDEVYLYKKAFSSDEVKLIYDATK